MATATSRFQKDESTNQWVLTPAKWEELVFQNVPSIRALIHQIQLGDHADGPQAWKQELTVAMVAY